MTDLTANDILATPAEPREFHVGIISLYRNVMADLGIDMAGCNTQGEFQDKGIFTKLHEKLLLPESYTIRGIFLHWPYHEWQIVVESPDLPAVEQHCEPPEIVPVYITVYDAEFPKQENKRYELREIKIEKRWQKTYSPEEVTLEKL